MYLVNAVACRSVVERDRRRELRYKIGRRRKEGGRWVSGDEIGCRQRGDAGQRCYVRVVER